MKKKRGVLLRAKIALEKGVETFVAFVAPPICERVHQQHLSKFPQSLEALNSKGSSTWNTTQTRCWLEWK